MFSVVTCGFRPAGVSALTADRAVRVLPHPASPEFLPQAIDLVDTLDPRHAVLCVHDGSAASEHRVRVLRSLVARSTVHPVGVRLPLTGLAALATVLASLSAARQPAGAVLASLSWVSASVPVQASTASVSRLDYSEIGASQQLASLLPWVRVPLRLGGTPQVGAAARAPLETTGPVAVLTAGDQRLLGDLPPVQGQVVESVEVPAEPPFGRDWWGTQRYVERCVVPVDLAALTRRMSSFPWRRCPECGEPMSSFCSFCSAQEVFA